MNSLILKIATRLILILMLLFSVFLLFRGHNEPGGGFIAGLVAASAFSLYVMANGPASLKKILYFDMHYWLATGLSCCLVSGMIGVFSIKPFLKGEWLHMGIVQIGTPTLFDIGVYVTVIAAVMMIVLSLEQKPKGDR